MPECTRIMGTLGELLCICALVSIASAQNQSNSRDEYWPQWRGPLGTGAAPQGDPPLEWSETENVRWKVEIPGRGHASPIVWGECIYVQTAAETGRNVVSDAFDDQPAISERRSVHGMGSAEAPTAILKFVILAIDRKTGNRVWQRTLCEALPHEGGHRDASQASNSPVTDGEHIIAYFGSRGVYCLDMRGEVVWKKDLGQMQTRRGFGEGSSPALYGDTVVINWDHEGDSFIVALDKNTGEQRWKVARDEPTSWATPIVLTVAGKPQVVTSATNRIRGYDLATGRLLWECAGMTQNVIPTPVHRDGLLYCTSGFRGTALLAIRCAEASGDITDSPAVLWKYDGKGTPYVPSPLLLDDSLYFLAGNKAVLSCVDANSGKARYDRQRLKGLDGVYASPVGARDRIYVVGREGKTAVVRHGSESQLLAMNTLDDSFTASPAIAGKEIYLRGHRHLYCIARD